MLCNRVKRDERKVGLKIDVRGKSRGMDGAEEGRVRWDGMQLVACRLGGQPPPAWLCFVFLRSVPPSRPRSTSPGARQCVLGYWSVPKYLPRYLPDI